MTRRIKRAETRTHGAVSQEGPDVQQAVTQAIAGLSERSGSSRTRTCWPERSGLPPENGVIERARAGIDEAISREQLIPLDREKGLFHQEFMCSIIAVRALGW
ncbi:hypothetical protein ACLBOM_35800 [Escherichia coli]